METKKDKVEKINLTENRYISIGYDGGREWALGSVMIGREENGEIVPPSEIRETLLESKTDDISQEDGVNRDNSQNTFSIYTGCWGFDIIDEFASEKEAKKFYEENKNNCNNINIINKIIVDKLINNGIEFAETDSGEFDRTQTFYVDFKDVDFPIYEEFEEGEAEYEYLMYAFLENGDISQRAERLISTATTKMISQTVIKKDDDDYEETLLLIRTKGYTE